MNNNFKCPTNNEKSRENCCGKLNIDINHPKWTGDNGMWDLSDEHHDINNCYSYSLNNQIPMGWRTDKLQPGDLSGGKYSEQTCKSIIQHVREDYMNKDIREVGLNDNIECNRYKIALVLSNNSDSFDYHFYRQDLNGNWSHKAGDNPISNVDASGKLIKDPQKANRNYNKTDNTDDDNNDYNIFCGYYSVRVDSSFVK